MSKKGVAISFNWMFSIIAGSIILSFFVYLAVQHTDLFGRVSARQTVEELDMAFSGFKTSLIQTELDFKKSVKLEFRCDESTLNKERLFVNKLEGKSLYDKIIFAPREMKSDRFLLWTYDLRMPFRVSNFIYLSSPAYEYGLKTIGNTPNFDKIKEELPELNGRDFFNIIDGQGRDRTVMFEGTNSVCSSSGLSEKERKVHYQYDSSLDEYYGWICTNNDKYPFYGKAMIYAAVFGEDFDCLYNLILERIKIMAKVYDEKASVLGRINNECQNYYYNLVSNLNSLKDFNDPNVIKNAVENIEEDNKRRLNNNCLLY